MSRAYMEKMLEPANLAELQGFFAKHGIYNVLGIVCLGDFDGVGLLDDVGMGDFTERGLKIPLTHNKGISAIAWRTGEGCTAPAVRKRWKQQEKVNNI